LGVLDKTVLAKEAGAAAVGAETGERGAAVNINILGCGGQALGENADRYFVYGFVCGFVCNFICDLDHGLIHAFRRGFACGFACGFSDDSGGKADLQTNES